MLEKLLQDLGLSEKEAKVYLAALELGKDTAQNIAKKAIINRPITYVIIDKLMKIGLISSVQEGKKTFFVASSPTELESLLERQDRELHDRKSELSKAMNQLMAVYNAGGDKPIVRFFEGADGLQAMDRHGRENLKKSDEILSIMPFDIIEKQFPERRKQSLSERVKLGIKSRTIYTHESGPIPESTHKKFLRQGVYISRKSFPINATLTIYPGWGIKIYYFDPNRPYGVSIESNDLAKNFKLIFELAWVGAQKLGEK